MLRKIQRELTRIGGQILCAPSSLFSYLFSTFYYDAFLSHKVQKTRGNGTISKKIAIYLIFPRSGVLQSHLAAIDYLHSAGYATLVVSNQRILGADRQKVLSRACMLLERPNFGYDFGGYRDGIIAIGIENLRKLDRLALFNDSCWFPIPGGIDWLRESEELNVDFAAASWHGAVIPRDFNNYEFVNWQICKRRRNFHYASFALNFKSDILRDARFWRFWKKYRLTNKKHKTVRRGEIGLTRWVLRHGYSHGCTTELAKFDSELMLMSEEEVNQIFSKLVVVADRQKKLEWRNITISTAENLSRRQREKIILALTSRAGMAYALASYLVRERRFAFLKKSLLREDETAAAIILETIQAFEGPMRDIILSEVTALHPEVTST